MPSNYRYDKEKPLDPKDKKVKQGTSVECLVDYDLFGININGEVGCYVCAYPEREKHLVWFPCNEEFAELKDKQFAPASKRISKECKDLVARIRKM